MSARALNTRALRRGARSVRALGPRPPNRRVMVRGFAPAVRGFALVPALFLIVVLGALAVIAVRVGVGQQQAATMSLQQARALAAAQAGIEWGAYQSIQAGACAASTTLTLTEAALAGFTVTVTCTASTFASGAATANSYVLKATAVIGTYGQPGYVRRVVSSTYSSAS